MNRRRISSRSAFTWIDVVVVVTVVAIAIALLIPALTKGTGDGRRASCSNNLKQIVLAIHNYGQATNVFPPGTICSTAPVQPSNQYDVWAEAAQTEPGFHGTGFLLSVLPFIEGVTVGQAWNYSYGVGGNAASEYSPPRTRCAWQEHRCFYCPSRRMALRPGDRAMMLSSSWMGGGTDYGGCAGRHAAFTLQTGYNLCDATMYYEPGFFPSPFKGEEDDTPQKRWGIFGRVNLSTKFSEITDGLSNTIMTGELQRITDLTPGSKDGWAVGGPATLFTTGAMMCRTGATVTDATQPNGGRLMNNGFWGSPGSDHPKGANFGMADGSVSFISDSIDPNIFSLLGSMADGGPADGWGD